MTGRYYAGRLVAPEFSPVTDFREARCRQYDEGVCDRGGYCNFMHMKHVPRHLRRMFRTSDRERGRDRDRGERSRYLEHTSFRFLMRKQNDRLRSAAAPTLLCTTLLCRKRSRSRSRGRDRDRRDRDRDRDRRDRDRDRDRRDRDRDRKDRDRDRDSKEDIGRSGSAERRAKIAGSRSI